MHVTNAAMIVWRLQGKPCDYFVMILEGRVEVCVGQEKMFYETGPFTVFGADFLMANQREQKNESKQKYLLSAL